MTPLRFRWIDFWEVEHIMSLAVVDFPRTPHRGAVPGFVSTSPACRRSCLGGSCAGVCECGEVDESVLIGG